MKPETKSRRVEASTVLLGMLLAAAAISTQQLTADGSDRVETPDPRRAQAELLHEVIHGSLQVMHRDFFNDEDPIAIPSQSLEDVFEALRERHGVEAKWLVVETDVVNIDHKPADKFERDAVAALKDGQDAYTETQNGQFRYAGAIPLSSQCLKCHLKLRTDVSPRTAGLVLTFPQRQPTD